MKRIAVMLLLLLAVAAAQDCEEVSLNRAATLAVVEYSDLQVAPQSIPSQLAVTENKSYWIVEFDSVWVPVTECGEVLKEEEAEILPAYEVHYALQKVIDQRDKDQYPTKKDMSLTLLLGDVDSKETYLVSSKAQLPGELQDDADKLVTAAEELKAAIQGSLDAITALGARENSILYSPAQYSDFGAWRTDFNALMAGFQSVADKGYAYDDERTAFNLEAQGFLNQSTDTAKNQLVQAFASGIAISNIPGSLPGLESTVGQWKANWLDVTLTDERIKEGASGKYTVYQEFFSGETVDVLQQEAYSKVQALASTVPLLLADLKACEDGLSAREQTDLQNLEEKYDKASDSYNEGREHQTSLDDTGAKEAYLNAISYAEDAAGLQEDLEGVECAGATPRPTATPDILGDFLGSIWGMAFIVLVVVLVGLYVWNSRKKNEGAYDEGEYVPNW